MVIWPMGQPSWVTSIPWKYPISAVADIHKPGKFSECSQRWQMCMYSPVLGWHSSRHLDGNKMQPFQMFPSCLELKSPTLSHVLKTLPSRYYSWTLPSREQQTSHLCSHYHKTRSLGSTETKPCDLERVWFSWLTWVIIVGSACLGDTQSRTELERTSVVTQPNSVLDLASLLQNSQGVAIYFCLNTADEGKWLSLERPPLLLE